MIGIIDYGVGNIFSVKKALESINVSCLIIKNPKDLENVQKIILPGVGHVESGMKMLRELNFIEPLFKSVFVDKKPILGICLGLELMTLHSEEGNIDCLGWLPAYTKKFTTKDENIRFPHMGWNTLKIIKNHPILKGIDENSEFYFAHSYFVSANENDIVTCKTEYGSIFDTILIKDNIFGFQFHPEKSHKFGLILLQNFANL